MKIYNIGYEKRSIEELCNTLVEGKISTLVDVRERAWSHRPEFRKTALSSALSINGIKYIHLKEAGNPYRPKESEDRDPAKCSSLYRLYLKNNPDVIEALVEMSEKESLAVFCYERERKLCHRGVLLEALKKKKKIKIHDL
jgi:uncharacterized protein (DUF488 family)